MGAGVPDVELGFVVGETSESVVDAATDAELVSAMVVVANDLERRQSVTAIGPPQPHRSRF